MIARAVQLKLSRSDIPTAVRTVFSKRDLLRQLSAIDNDVPARQRILRLEASLRSRTNAHLNTLPPESAKFDKFNTSPFVLMIHCLNRGYTKVSEIEKDILPAKQFSSMETSAGRMVEAVALPLYGWDVVPSGMHSANSSLDGRRVDAETLHLATLKSGPRCLNDEMSENFADGILAHYESWAKESNRKSIEFTYGVLYGTPRVSNKKDWHILRNVVEKLPIKHVIQTPKKMWWCAFEKNGIAVSITVRIGKDWWAHLGGTQWCFLELCIALIRTCVHPGDPESPDYLYTISDLGAIVSMESVPQTYNIALLQHSQIPWLFFLARHFCDELVD